MLASRHDRRRLLRRGLLLEIFTVLWNFIEGVVAVAAGTVSGSVALIGFGIDSFVETASAVVVGWRLDAELRERSAEASERFERIASRTAGALLLLLAAYVALDAGRRLLGFGPEARESLIGIVLTSISLVVMPFLGWSKLRTATALNSRALRADAYETIACAWLSLTTLVGLALNASFGWWWADPLAALVLVPLIVREGLEGLRGDECGCGDDD
jgi:cation diffusion facilitator family transporter